MKTIISIDPGISGAVCIWRGGVPTVEDMPTMKRGKASVIDVANLAHIIGGIDGPVDVIIEDVTARPGNGSVSMFSFGRNVGRIEAVPMALGYAVRYVRPVVWKRGVGLPVGATKEQSRSMAIERFPALAGDLRRKKDEGRAESVLIGAWAMGTK